MPFKKGNRLQEKRKRCKGGRPTREEAAAKETAQQKALRLIEEAAEKIVEKYLRFAQKNAATARHYMDKLLPDEYEIGTPDSATIEIRVKRKVENTSKPKTGDRVDRHHRQIRVSS